MRRMYTDSQIATIAQAAGGGTKLYKHTSVFTGYELVSTVSTAFTTSNALLIAWCRGLILSMVIGGQPIINLAQSGNVLKAWVVDANGPTYTYTEIDASIADDDVVAL